MVRFLSQEQKKIKKIGVCDLRFWLSAVKQRSCDHALHRCFVVCHRVMEKTIEASTENAGGCVVGAHVVTGSVPIETT